jgi:hypothetical protein
MITMCLDWSCCFLKFGDLIWKSTLSTRIWMDHAAPLPTFTLAPNLPDGTAFDGRVSTRESYAAIPDAT